MLDRFITVVLLWIHKEVEGYKMLVIGFRHPSYDPHFPECEDFEGYHCKPCNHIIEAGLPSRNWCEWCGKFASKAARCVCPEIEDEVI